MLFQCDNTALGLTGVMLSVRVHQHDFDFFGFGLGGNAAVGWVHAATATAAFYVRERRDYLK